MQCYNHPDVPAIMQCKGGCTRGLCKECSEIHAEPYCDFCVKEVDSQNKTGIEDAIKFNEKQIMKLAVCVGWGILWTLFGIKEVISEIARGAAFGDAVWGMVFAFIFGGIPYVIFYFRDQRSQETKSIQALHVGFGWYFIGNIIMYSIVSGIACPIIMVYGVYQVRKLVELNKELKVKLASHN